MLILNAKNDRRGPWTIRDLASLFELRADPLSDEQFVQKVLDRRLGREGAYPSALYLAGNARTLRAVRSAIVASGCSLSIGVDLAMADSDDLLDGYLFLCERNRDAWSRRDRALAVIVGSASGDDAMPVDADWLGVSGERGTLTLGGPIPLGDGNGLHVYLGHRRDGAYWCACVNSAPFASSVRLENRGQLRELVRVLRITEPADVLRRIGAIDG